MVKKNLLPISIDDGMNYKKAAIYKKALILLMLAFADGTLLSKKRYPVLKCTPKVGQT
ncbi:MAG TPA: hypothetical protein VEV16_02205 [Daejeonella sp.]|nr:hypothetical protein [Daejeonella sp.]